VLNPDYRDMVSAFADANVDYLMAHVGSARTSQGGLLHPGVYVAVMSNAL
jgi:hypothetical protein